MYAYAPDSAPAHPAVLVAAHYCTGTRPGFYSGTEFDRLADQYGFIVVHPGANVSGQCLDVSSPRSHPPERTPRASCTVSGVYRFLLSRQWVILTLVALLLIPTMIRLGIWQMHRYEERTARNQLVADALSAEPVPVEKLTSPGHTVTTGERYHTVSAKGRFDTEHEVVVRRRTNSDDEVGYHVLTPFVLDDGKVLLVNRGWIPADGPSQTTFPAIPAPPRGEITVTGRLMPAETTAASGIKDLKGLPDRQIMLINSEQEARRLGAEVLGGYIVLTTPAPKGDTPEPLGKPGDENAALNYAYAIQWWLFSAGVPLGWVILVRRERRDRAEAEAVAREARDAADAEPAAV